MEGAGPERETAKVGFPYFGGIVSEHFPNNATGDASEDVLVRTVPVQRLALGKDGEREPGGHRVRPAGGQLRRGARPARRNAARDFDDDTPYTPAWQERITGVKPREQLIAPWPPVRRQRRQDQGKSMVIIGAAMNHWYHAT
jgi:nitrate reductase alpha subunit